MQMIPEVEDGAAVELLLRVLEQTRQEAAVLAAEQAETLAAARKLVLKYFFTLDIFDATQISREEMDWF